MGIINNNQQSKPTQRACLYPLTDNKHCTRLVATLHNYNWLHHYSYTSREGIYVELLAETNNLTQLVKEPIYCPNVEGQRQNVLDLCMTSNLEKYEVYNLAPLGNSDHMTISASFSYFPSMSVSIKYGFTPKQTGVQ